MHTLTPILQTKVNTVVFHPFVHIHVLESLGNFWKISLSLHLQHTHACMHHVWSSNRTWEFICVIFRDKSILVHTHTHNPYSPPGCIRDVNSGVSFCLCNACVCVNVHMQSCVRGFKKKTKAAIFPLVSATHCILLHVRKLHCLSLIMKHRCFNVWLCAFRKCSLASSLFSLCLNRPDKHYTISWILFEAIILKLCILGLVL